MSPARSTDRGSWHGRRCLITGAEGFLAAHLAERLLEEGALVYGAVRPRVRVCSSLDLFSLRSKLTVFVCDARDYRGILDILASEKIDSVFHLAAASTVNTSARMPLATIESNVLGTANLLESCRQTGVERIVVASSDKAYGDHPSSLPYTESHSLQGLNVYGCSKSCTDLIAQMYYFQYHLPVRITRCCNIYGPGDLSFSRLVPGTIARILAGMRPIIRPGQAQVKREYVFVSDVVEAYLMIARSIPKPCEQIAPPTDECAYSDCAYNIGSGKANVQTAAQMIELMQDMMGSDLKPQELGRRCETCVEVSDQYLDTHKIRDELGFVANIGLNTGLSVTIEWYRKHRDMLRPLYEAEILER